MAVTVTTNNYGSIDTCENASNWTGETPNDTTDFYKEGNQCVGFVVKGSGNNDVYITGTWDLSGTKHLRGWMMTVAIKELTNFQLYMSDGSNTGYWNIISGTDYPGGWYNIAVDLSRAVDSGTKPTMSSITTIGFRFVHTGTAKNAENTWLDFIHYNDGLVCYGDLSGSPFDFDDILSADENTTNGWGIIRKIGGVYFLTGSLTWGDSSGTNSCDFEDSGQTIVFADRPVNSSLYELEVVGNATGTTEFVLGAKSGGRGISGCTFRTEDLAQTPKFDVTCIDTDVGTFKVYGSTFIDADLTQLPTTSANREVISCSFEVCGTVDVSTCKVQYCNFINADDFGVEISSTSHGVSDCNFIQCGHGIHFDTAGDYTLASCVFSGSDGSSYYDIENSVNSNADHADRSYSESNRDEDISLDDTTTAAGQSLNGDGNVMGHCFFHLSKSNSPTGSAYAKLYAHTGTYGTDGTPTGAVLATSETIDVSDLTGTPTLTKFIFSDDEQYTLVSGTKYFIVIEYTNGTSSNKVLVGDDGSSPTHGGNAATYAASAWTDDDTKDVCFYVRTGGIVNVSGTGTSNPSQAYVEDSGTPEGTTFIDISFALVVIGLELNTEVTIVTQGTSTELFHEENATISDGDGKYKITYTHPGGENVDILIHHVDYLPDISNVYDITLPNADSTIKIKMFDDDFYYNPT